MDTLNARMFDWEFSTQKGRMLCAFLPASAAPIYVRTVRLSTINEPFESTWNVLIDILCQA